MSEPIGSKMRIESIHFDDETLKTCILEEDKEYVIEIRTLSCKGPEYDQPIRSLTGLEYFTELEILNLDNNQLTNADELQHLTKLRDLFLQDNDLQDFPQLPNSKYLENLLIGGNELQNLNGIEHLTSLKLFHADNNNLTSIDGISGLKELKKLVLINNKLNSTSLNELTQLKSLYWVDLKDNDSITDITDIPTDSLKNLRIEGTSVTNICITGNINKLEKIRANNSKINTGFTCLANTLALYENTSMKKVELEGNPITDCTILVPLEERIGGDKIAIDSCGFPKEQN